MEATVTQQIQFSSWIDSRRIAAKPKVSLNFSPLSFKLQLPRPSNHQRTVSLKVSCSYHYQNSTVLESGNHCAPIDESLILQKKSQEIQPYLNGRCIYLVGMMGSGKTTVGKVLAKAVGYSFSDSDTLVEEEFGSSVAEIFKLHGEDFFREKETEALRKISLMNRLVVSTGGGVVTRTINWKYMHKGISVWLDVPLEALVKRISAVGTNTRPLLHQDSTDAYSKVRGVEALYLYHNRPVWYQFLTATFCHASWNHLSSNLFFLYIFGKLVEEEEGNFALWLSYILTGVGANIVSWLILPRNAVSVGASGAVFGLFSISVLVKMSWDWRKILEVLILGQFVIEKVMEAAQASTAMSGSFRGGSSLQNVNHVAHLSGALVGVFLVWLLSRIPSQSPDQDASALHRKGR